MKLAIVGSSKVPNSLVVRMRNVIEVTLQQFDNPMILSGGANGVDTIAVGVAKHMGLQIEEYKPKEKLWESYKERNQKIALECDQIYCFATGLTKTKCYHHTKPENHERTAGCWTLRRVKELNKPTALVVVKEIK
jgi:hypothetical protein